MLFLQRSLPWLSNIGWNASPTWSHRNLYFSVREHTHIVLNVALTYVFIQKLITSHLQLTFFSDATSGRLRTAITSQQVAPSFPYPWVCPLCLHVNVSYFCLYPNWKAPVTSALQECGYLSFVHNPKEWQVSKRLVLDNWWFPLRFMYITFL